jgi:hypothetical protein
LPNGKGLSIIYSTYLQQSACVHVDLSHFCPLGQLVQIACLVFTFLAGTWPFAITEVAAKAIASILNIIFFIYLMLLVK